MGARAPSDVTFRDVDDFITAQADRGLKAPTINRHLAAIASVYIFLSDEDPTLVCPVLPHRHTLRERKCLPRPAPEEDIRRFFSAIDDRRDLAMFLLMLRCGLRIAEVTELRLRDLYLGESPPRLLVHGKYSKERSAYLSPQSLQALRAYLARRGPTASDHIFLSYQGAGMSTTAIHKLLMHYRETNRRQGVASSPSPHFRDATGECGLPRNHHSGASGSPPIKLHDDRRTSS